MTEENPGESDQTEPAGAAGAEPTGPAGSDGEREAARRLARELRDRGLAVVSEPAYFRPAIGLNRSLHALLAVAGGMIALDIPLLGAAICLIAAFSWYADRALVTPLLGRLLPRRPTQNVLSPPPGPAWENVRLVIGTGYDLDSPSPFSSWLSRRLTGLLTVDRLTLWAGMVPVFLSAMLRVADLDGTAVGIVQLAGSAVLLGVVASEVDRGLSRSPRQAGGALASAECLLEVVDALDPGMVEGQEVAVGFFGAEHSASAGAREFFKRLALPTGSYPAVLGLVALGNGGGASVTVREGDLAMARMTPIETDSIPAPLDPVILRRESVASMGRRRGLEAVTVLGENDDLISGTLELVEAISRDDPEHE